MDVSCLRTRTGEVRRLGIMVILVAATALTACASKTWTKAGVSAEQFEIDKSRCTREFLTPGAGGAVRNYAVEPACMQKLGYKLE